MNSSFVSIALALAALTVTTGCRDDGGSAPARSYALGLRVDDGAERYRYVATGDVDIRVGDEVTFEFENTGRLVHDVNVVDPAGNTLASAGPLPPASTARITARFDEAGFFRLNCLVDDHLTAHEMQTLFEVTDPVG